MDKALRAYIRGYRVTANGTLLSPNGDDLVTSSSSTGYPAFTIRYNNRSLKIHVHRLQAFQKFGESLFEPGIQVRHLDGGKENNSWDNIAIGTNQDNQLDIPEHIRVSRALHATSFCRKHDKEAIREFHENSGRSYKATMERFGISSKGTLHFILNK